MKSPLIIGVSALALLTLSATLFAQTATGGSLITQMKAVTHAFTLAGDLNPGTTGLESSPLVGKRTGDQLSAAEYNRILELVGQGGGGSNTISLKIKRLTGVSESCTSVCLAESKSCVVGFLADNSFSVTVAAVLRGAMDCNQSVAAAVYSLECLCSSGGGGGASSNEELAISQESTAKFSTIVAAMEYCRDLSEGGNTDWRFPGTDELYNFIGSTTSTNFLWTSNMDWSQATGTILTDYWAKIRLSDGHFTTTTGPGDSPQSTRCVRGR